MTYGECSSADLFRQGEQFDWSFDMNEYDIYSRVITRSVDHIFKNFLNDNSIKEVYETQSKEKDPQVAIEIDGTLKGEIVINIPVPTLNLITKKFIGTSNQKIIKKSHPDVAGELANLITGTIANQLQYTNQTLTLSPPEFNNESIIMKALYDNINLSFVSSYGGFDIDFYYKTTG